MSLRFSIYGCAALCFLTCGPARAVDDAQKAHLVQFASERLAATAAAMDPTRSPEFTKSDGTWSTVANTDQYGWVQGFFPGSNWYLFDLTGDANAKTRADRWTRSLEAQKNNRQTHDLGFKLYLSFGHAYRSTGDTYYKDVLLTAAASLASRYDPTIGVVVCCDWNSNWHRPTVADTMMNLELLHWGAANGGDPAWKDMAVHHALKMITDLVRPDGSTYHVIDYSTRGDILWRGTDQGYSNDSTWTRGHAWAIYGFTVQYRYTGDSRMLAEAQKLADYFLGRLGNDPIPNWDFDAPSIHKDTSAAAVVASALYELSGFVGGDAKDRYLQAANRILDALASSTYLAEGSSNAAILLHGTANVLAGKGIDAGLSYGDHYFLEALARRPPQPAGTPDAGADGGTPPDAGAGSDGGGGVPPDAGGAAGTTSSSGCATGGVPPALSAALLALALMRARRRQKTR